jgi:glucose/arabinose dehydrogenase
MITFGPDGYLYIALGDGGGVGDRYDNGQNPHTLLGTILRIDVNDGDPYAVPADNPFADGEGGAPEVWLWGLRNPWRFSFDGDDMWIGDVGEGSREEIDLIAPDRAGANLGWPILEGNRCFDGPQSLCDDNDFIDPVFEYGHDGGRCSVTGGYVYRGLEHPELAGAYLFGDYCRGDIVAIRVEDGEVVESREYAVGIGNLRSFGIDHDGEVYVTAGTGVYRVGLEG